ncbi:MAG TPA: subclass B1 metallo-beta-lactamase [Pseudobacteroides sp.]|uniref:subclass B1 metallo-beta-lactamase n=1 Tax=Pseudobacteroides sp. TaxID=1968840 RepID=UPI002F93452E
MKKICLFLVTLVFLSLYLMGCSNKSEDVKVKESFLKSGSDDSNYVELTKINDYIWVHTTYANYNGSRTPSNGVIAVSSKGLVLVDTPWNNPQTKELIKFSKSVFKKDIVLAIITHAHEDRIGGIDTLIENKVDVRSTSLTVKEAEKNGFKKPVPELDSEPKITFGNINIEVFYPGEGHTVDNITVWFQQYKVLFGGCLIKSLDASDIGNIADVNVKRWPDSVKKVLEKYADAEVVIPGHGKWGSLDLLNHTLELVSK